MSSVCLGLITLAGVCYLNPQWFKETTTPTVSDGPTNGTVADVALWRGIILGLNLGDEGKGLIHQIRAARPEHRPRMLQELLLGECRKHYLRTLSWFPDRAFFGSDSEYWEKLGYFTASYVANPTATQRYENVVREIPGTDQARRASHIQVTGYPHPNRVAEWKRNLKIEELLPTGYSYPGFPTV